MMVLMIPAFCIANAQISREDFIRVTKVDGKAIIEHGFNESDEEAFMNSIITEGDTLETYDGARIEAMFERGLILRVNERSRVHFLAVNSAEDNIILRLEHGDIIIDASIANMGNNNFRVDAVDCSVYLIQEGVFRIVSDEVTDVMVYSGAVEVATQSNSYSLRAGQRIFNVRDESARPEYFNTFANDEFSRWSEYRQSYYRNSRVPESYANNISAYDLIELEEYGTWRYESEFGYVWVPHVTVEWRPYLYGHWVWFPWGWAWVSYEPWGWAPYHYGRWHFSVSIGWFWIPRPVFGLSWVYWYDWNDYVGWCPLDYYDRPIFFSSSINNYYYRPNPKSWTIIPKAKLGYRDLYKHAIETYDSEKLPLIDKHKLIRAENFTYRPQNIPAPKTNWKDNITQYKEFFKKPLNRNYDYQDSIRKYDRQVYPRDNNIETPQLNKEDQFRRFKEKLDTYRKPPSSPQYREYNSRSYSPNYKIDTPYDSNIDRSQIRRKEDKSYQYPEFNKENYRDRYQNENRDREYYRNYYKNNFPNEDIVPKNYSPLQDDHDGNVIRPYYRYEAQKFMENMQKEGDSRTIVPSTPQKIYTPKSSSNYDNIPPHSSGKNYDHSSSKPSSSSSPQRKKP
jgi:hypothetical protein